MITAIAFTMYPVADMSRARAFYETVLGLTVARTFGDAWIEYDLRGATFAISSMAEGVSPSADAGGSIAFEVTDVDQIVANLRAKHVRVKLEPMSTPVCRMAVILDSEGNALTLHQATKTW
ncbi:MAG TPA: VOC family protein [Nitrospira sp.]